MRNEITILIVDDDAMIRDCMIAFFEDEGFRVHTSASGEEALMALPLVKPDICIIDLRLPGMSGELFIQSAHGILPQSHFMIHTGSSYVLPNELRALGMNSEDVLLKPVHDLTLLAARLENIVAVGRPS